MNKDLLAIFEYLEKEKGIKRDIIVSAIEEALLAAARKSLKGLLNVSVTIEPKTAEIVVKAQKEIVDKVTIPDEEISIDIAREIDPECEVGQWVEITVTPEYFGRIAAQTARQVIAQKLRGAERDVIYEEYRHRINDIVSGAVKRVGRGGTLIVDLGKVEGILPDRFFPKKEHYEVGDRVQALLFEVRDTENGGAEVVLSRNHTNFVVQLFKQEVPEINDGTVVIERIARDPGYRTKMAVRSHDHKVDPVGATVGVRGTRVKNIIRELNNEKIDIMPYSENPVELLQNAMAPVEIRKIQVNDEDGSISIVVEDEDYPTVLGKRGMNTRLTAELLDRELNVQKMSEYQRIMSIQRAELAQGDDPTLDEPLRIKKMSSFVIESLISAGFDTPRKILNASLEELTAIPEISVELADQILEEVKKMRA